MDYTDMINTFSKIKEFCKNQGQCIDCRFLDDGLECELYDYAPCDWDIEKLSEDLKVFIDD